MVVRPHLPYKSVELIKLAKNVTIVLDGVVQIPPQCRLVKFFEVMELVTWCSTSQSQFIESGFITNTHISVL